MICRHCERNPRKRGEDDPQRDGDSGHFHRRGKESSHRRRRAFINIRRPHVKRHGRHFEGEPGHQEHKTEDNAERRLSVDGFGDARKGNRAGEAIEKRSAIKQHAGRQRAEDEIFEAGFRRPEIVAVERGNDVKGKRHQFEPKIERDETGRRNQHQHAEGRQKDQNRKLEFVDFFARQKILAHHQGDEGSAKRQHLHEAPETVVDEGAVEDDRRGLARRAE